MNEDSWCSVSGDSWCSVSGGLWCSEDGQYFISAGGISSDAFGKHRSAFYFLELNGGECPALN